ncbi:hypothetical protein AAF712_007393 [Marasmius tenuissimus]|uniref:Uncharacterized protein n=1 Tax=Marasmius tenuissimus TaxID=585030 RepID=A0ABR2ZWB7_9AGAR
MRLIRFSILSILASHYRVVASNNFTLCLYDIQHTGSRSGVNNLGQFVRNPDDATAIPYITCVNECGTSPDIRPWTLVAQEFSAWLLPYLALLSQLLFGAHDRWDNLLAGVLTIGSPALAAYSVAVTVLNERWLVRLFNSYSWPNRRNAVRVLSSLQQSPIRIGTDRRLLASLVVLPENDAWWSELVAWLDYAHTWSISAASFIAWVVITYAFTIANSFTGDVTTKTAINGHDSMMVKKALDRANKIAYVVGPSDRDPVLASRISGHRAIYLDRDRAHTLHPDQRVTVPIYNYARLFTWTEAVREVATCFSNATTRADSFEPGTSAQVEKYCSLELGPLPPNHSSGVWTRLAIASLAGLGLQWSTTSAAFLTVYLTPTTGLGCRSGAYLVYTSAATLVMIMLILSSILAHYASACSPQDPLRPHIRPLKGRLFAWSSIFLRRSGKILGFLNAMWLITVSVMSRGADKAYMVVIETLDPNIVKAMMAGWISGMVLGVGTAVVFIVFMNLMVQKIVYD